MTKVFVHGNPESAAIWQDLLAALADLGVDDTVCLSPPGFGAPVPADWVATPSSYVTWLTDQVRTIEGPIDLIGHDWGAGHVLGFLATEPPRVRSWASDCLGLVHPHYDWHDAAKTWQTPGEGETAIDAMVALPTADLSQIYQGLGLTEPIAEALAQAMNPDMGRCVLDLYRAAVQPMLRDLGVRLEATELPPGLVINPTDDPYVSADLGRDAVDRFGASLMDLEGHGHWWMVSEPARAAEGLVAFWNQLD